MNRRTKQTVGRILTGMVCAVVAGCNNPYPVEDAGQRILYSSFSSEPAHLDPAIAYSAWLGQLQGQVLEPPFQYHLLRRPYELIPLAATGLPEAQTREIKFAGKTVTATFYVVEIQKGIHYQKHPCFVAENRGLTPADVVDVETVWDIEPVVSRELTAADYVCQIRRLADSRLACPIYTTLAQNLLGMADYRAHLDSAFASQRAERRGTAGVFYNREQDEQHNPLQIDYADGAEAFPFVRQVDRYRFEVVLAKPYPQILYWMTMAFFAPTPLEALEFFNQRVLLERAITFDRNLVGTGPFVLRKVDPTNEIVLVRNREYRDECYPDLPRPAASETEALAYWQELKAAGMLEDVGKRLPMVDKWVMRMEKEASPRWQKFKQGYYDTSNISSDTFDQAVQLTSHGDAQLTRDLVERGIRMLTFHRPIISYFAFNMSDPVYGGYTESACKLRQAVSIAYDSEEYIAVFQNGRGKPAHDPLAPGIFGYEEGRVGMNEVVYEWDEVTQSPRRRTAEQARQLLAEAGYPGGFGPDGTQLTLTFLSTSSGPGAEPELNFLRKQLEKLNIRLVLDVCDPNRRNEKAREGNYQFIQWGWLADYPDPENFLFLLYGPNGREQKGEGNLSNYRNAEFDRLFREMETMPNSPERLAIIRRMLKILRGDAPWIFRMNPADYSLYHEWYHNGFPHGVASNLLKYRRIEPDVRTRYRRVHNRPRVWPAVVVIAALLVFSIPAAWLARRHLREL